MMVVVEEHAITGVFINTSTLPDDLDYKYNDGSFNPIVDEYVDVQGIFVIDRGLAKQGG